MQTFCAVGDAELIKAISQARKRVVYVAPGISGKVAEALGERFREIGNIDVTAVLDPAEDVCRIGYGDQQGLEKLQSLVATHHLVIRKQEGLRIGVLIADDTVLVWSPTPQSVEATPTSASQPNGLRLGANPTESLVKAIAPEGTDTVTSTAEIGQTAVTQKEVKETVAALEANPVIPVALSQVTRVFSTKLQFVELEVKNAKLSRVGLTVPRDQLNVDVAGELQGLIDTKLRAFGDLRCRSVDVPAFTRTGEASLGKGEIQRSEPMSEADLEAVRREIERRFLYGIRGHGTLIARDQKLSFEQCVDAYSKQLKAHAAGLRTFLAQQSATIVDEAVKLVEARARHATGGPRKIDSAALRQSLDEAIKRLVDGEPSVTRKYKDVTFEHTQNEEFRNLVRKALPADVQKRLGNWDTHFQAAKEQATKKAGIG